MGPITLFDKSFLQSLTVDESVWFNNFFLTNICPLFYVETLADLEKAVREGRTPEQEVGIIASKFPENGTPSVYHRDMCVADLQGYPVPMTGQIVVPGGRPVKSEGRGGFVFAPSAEAEAFSRWQDGKFLELERLYARIWRQALASLDLEQVAKGFRAIGIDGKSCKTVQDAKVLADAVIAGSDKPFDRLYLAVLFLNIPPQLRETILKRWSIAGYPPLFEYVPYTAHVLSVDIFFQLSLAARLISSSRPSNRVDIGYLYYLPFCMVFVSSDKLHRTCAPLFLRDDQDFVWGEDLKKDLQSINAYYQSLPEATKELGLTAFANSPPKDGDFLVTKLWDRHLPTWRKIHENDELNLPRKNENLLGRLKKFAKAPTLRADEIDFNETNPDALVIERVISKRRGSWWQLPKNLESSEDA